MSGSNSACYDSDGFVLADRVESSRVKGLKAPDEGMDGTGSGGTRRGPERGEAAPRETSENQRTVIGLCLFGRNR